MAVISKVTAKGSLRGSGAPGGDGDPRFTLGLLCDVGRVLEAHGFSALETYTGNELLRLQRALFEFLHPREKDGDW